MHSPSSIEPMDTAAGVSAEPGEHPLWLTRAAVSQVKDFLLKEGQDGNALSIRVSPAGCSGLGYDVSLGPPRMGDLVWEQDGVKLTTDPFSLEYLRGTVVDYVSSLEGSGFKFANPQARASCGCGESFTA